MKKRIVLFSSLLGAVALVLLLVWAVGAQGPEPGEGKRPGRGPVEQPFEGGVAAEHKPFPRPAPSGGLGAQGVSAAVSLGQPGTVFRYVQRFGTTEEGYFEDTSHFYGPSGVGTDGTSVWIADSWGNRVVKFDSTGNFQQQIGKASFREATDTSLDYITDVAVDSSGNIWVVDGGAAHVAQFNSGGNLVRELGEAWNSGSDNSHFNDPIGIAFDSAGNIYVSDSGLWGEYGNHRVQVFDSSGNYITTIGQTGVCGSANNQFCSPRRIAIYAGANCLYVADAGNHRVQIFNISTPSSPTYVATLGVSGVSGSDNSHFDYPEGVAVDASYIYVADSNNNRVQIFNRTTYAYVATIGSWGTGNDQFRYPTDVAVDTAGNIYVADEGNHRVQQFNSSRVYQRTYGTTGVPYLTDGYHYNYPTGVAVAGDGSIYIVEERGKRLVKLNSAGVPQWTVGEPGISGDDNSHFRYPKGVALDSAGRVYVADTVNNRVQIYNSNSTYYATLGTGEGNGNYQFDQPNGVAVHSAGNIYVADTDNHRIQVYNASRTYIGTIGVTDVSGNDNSHFNEPYDVAVDSAGNVYVADLNNHRVQKCVPSGSIWNCTTIVGETGVPGDDFGHLSNPIGITVDAAGRIYVADGWGGRVQVFDSTGAYLTTIGGSWGNRTGQMRQADGLAVDSAGNLYIAECLNHRIQKFAPGVPGWRQVNINGFGNRSNVGVLSLAVFSDTLYAGTINWDTGGEIWRMASPWTAVITGGLGYAYNVGIDHLAEFNGQLYAGTWADETNGGEVWRSSNGLNWTRVVSQGFGDPTNGEVFRFAVFSDTLYASTWSYTDTHGVEIWRSSTGNAGDWTRVVTNGFDGDTGNEGAPALDVFNGYLYAGTINSDTGGEVWRTNDGTNWSQVNTDGFGDSDNWGVSSFAVFNGYLYAGTGNDTTGGQVWRCSTASGCDENSDWEQVVGDGFGDGNNFLAEALIASDNYLYCVTGNGETGAEVWRTADGTQWEQVGFAGLGDSNNRGPYWDNSVVAGSLYIGTWNWANGGEVWLFLHRRIYLPIVLKNYRP